MPQIQFPEGVRPGSFMGGLRLFYGWLKWYFFAKKEIVCVMCLPRVQFLQFIQWRHREYDPKSKGIQQIILSEDERLELGFYMRQPITKELLAYFKGSNARAFFKRGGATHVVLYDEMTQSGPSEEMRLWTLFMQAREVAKKECSCTDMTGAGDGEGSYRDRIQKWLRQTCLDIIESRKGRTEPMTRAEFDAQIIPGNYGEIKCASCGQQPGHTPVVAAYGDGKITMICATCGVHVMTMEVK